MKRVFLFFLCVVLCTSAVFADDELSDDIEPVQDNNTASTPVVVDITSLLNMTDSKTDPKEEEPKEVYVIEPQLVNVETSIEKVSASDTTGFKSVILGLLGDYETVVTDYTYNNGSYQSHTINIERDWAWICSCCIFGVLLWCTFRTIGGICARW